MLMFFSRLFLVFLLSTFLWGCSFGTHTISVSTDPTNAKVYQEGRLVGETPHNFPLPWRIIGGYWESPVPIRIEKEGYKTLNTFLRRVWNYPPEPPNWLEGSEFGNGNTYFLHLKLEPEK